MQDVLPVELRIPNHESSLGTTLGTGHRAATEGMCPCQAALLNVTDSRYTDGPVLIILALVTSNIRNCHLPSSKVHALDVLLALAPHLTDEAKLDRMVPYIVDLLHDEFAIVRLAAVRTLIQTVRGATFSASAEEVKHSNFAAHDGYGHHSFERCYISRIYNSEHQVPSAGSGSLCAVCVCSIYRASGRNSCEVS